MEGISHKIFIATMVLIVAFTFAILCYIGFSYYQTSVEERFFHPAHNFLKPSAVIGHGLGIVGSLLMIFGMLFYMTRKRMRALSRWGSLKNWLELHIFLCTLGPMLVLFHTSFKFGGLVAVSFWSMVAVFLSGIIGRFIYIQIPRSIEGRELSLNEVRGLKTDLDLVLKSNYNLNEETSQTIFSAINSKSKDTGGFIKMYFRDFQTVRLIKKTLKEREFSKTTINKIVELVKKDMSLSRKIERLVTMQKLFNYWHVAHLPFALVMLIIMVIHVVVTIVFGYKWIF
jgi:hypothetical protein